MVANYVARNVTPIQGSKDQKCEPLHYEFKYNNKMKMLKNLNFWGYRATEPIYIALLFLVST